MIGIGHKISPGISGTAEIEKNLPVACSGPDDGDGRPGAQIDGKFQRFFKRRRNFKDLWMGDHADKAGKDEIGKSDTGWVSQL